MKNYLKQKGLNFISNYLEIIGTIFIVLVLVFFLWRKEKQVNEHGVITIAKVIDWSTAGDGSSLEIEIYFHNKIYKTTLNIGCGGNCVGNYYFIKINKDDPADYPIFYRDKKVPDCILQQNPNPLNGWKDFPACK